MQTRGLTAELGMEQISCGHCSHVFPAGGVFPGDKVQCPSCGESFVPPVPAPPKSGPGQGGVFILGALLLAAVVILVAIFWNSLLKKREVRPKKDGEKKTEVWNMGRTFHACSARAKVFSPNLPRNGLF